MMKLRNTIYYVLCLMMSASTLTGCIEEYEADIAEEDANLLVVEGTICSGQTNKFYLSRTQPISNVYAPYWVNDAKVSVRGTDGSEYPATKNYAMWSTICISRWMTKCTSRSHRSPCAARR